MYILKTEHSFDSAHFLAGYEGKCANIHGHRWRVEIEVQAEELVASGQLDGMVVDFGDLKKDLKAAVDHLDHALIIEQGTMREQTLAMHQGRRFCRHRIPIPSDSRKFRRTFLQNDGWLGL